MPGNNFSLTAQKILGVLSQYSNFAVPILTTQCKRINKTPQSLEPADLRLIVENIGTAVASFTSPMKGEKVKEELSKLL